MRAACGPFAIDRAQDRRGKRDAGLARGKEDIGIGPDRALIGFGLTIPGSLTRVIGVVRGHLAGDDREIILAPDQFDLTLAVFDGNDLAAEGARLIRGARDHDEIAILTAEIDPGKLRRDL